MIDNQLYSAGQLIILGDFNYHLDCINNSLATQFKSLLKSSNLSQHVVGPTHKHGHTLDLVITRSIPGCQIWPTSLKTSTREKIN